MKTKNYLKLFLFIGIISTITSCKEVASEMDNWMDVEEGEEIPGTYHFLENDGIKVFLPEVFQRYTTVAYEKVLDSLLSKKDFEIEAKRLKNQRNVDGNFYIFFDETSRSTFTVNTLPFMPLEKQDAQMLLGMIRQTNENLFKGTDFTWEKVKANYSSNNALQVFRAVYKIERKKKKQMTYETNYFVSSKDKTFLIKLATGNEVDFMPYFQKMIIN